MTKRQNIEPIMMTPGIAGYWVVNRSGRHGFCRFPKATGSKCTKAVAMSTPVPKCLHIKNAFCGTFNHETFFAATGKPAPNSEAAKTMTAKTY